MTVVGGPRPPAVGMCTNLLEGIRPEKMRPVGIGRSIAELALEEEAKGLLIVKVNGVVLSRLTELQRVHIADLEAAGEDTRDLLKVYASLALNWHFTRTAANDVVHFYDYPMGRDGVRVLLSVAIVISAIVPGLQFLTPYLVAASIAYNILVPPKLPNQQAGADDIFSTSLTGNQAEIDQPIWRNCGRIKVTPPFAGMPYLEFKLKDPKLPNGESDQYFFAVYAVGVGDHDIEKAFIGRTSIKHFSDVLVAQYLAPGVQPSTALANVVTSTEVSSAELDPGTYVGGFAVCQPQRKAASIGIDVGAQQGLGSTDDSITTEWQVEYRKIDDFGRPAANWAVLAREGKTANTNTQLRWSFRYALPEAMRCEIRVVRTNPKDTDSGARDSIQWIGLRAYMSEPAPLNPNTAHYEVVLRSSQQLNDETSHDVSMIVRAKTRVWSPTAGFGPVSGDGENVFTRNAAWWLLDLWTNPIWGEGIPLEQIDLQGLYDWSVTLDARQDHFDYSFAAATDAWTAAQLIAGSGRARVFRRNGIYTLARDEKMDLAVAAFTSRNTQPSSMSMTTTLPQLDAPQGIIAEYLSNVSWDMTNPIECPCPGYTVTDPDSPRYDSSLPEMQNPVYITLQGVTGAFHAEREGLYQAYNMALRTTSVTCVAEMEGQLVAFMDPVRWQPLIRGYGQSGDVAFWDAGSLVMGLSEPPDFSGEQPYLTLQRDDGTLTTPVPVLPGPTEWDVTLPGVPDFDLILDDGLRERPKFILGPLDSCDELVKITDLTDGGKSDDAQLYKIDGLVDDDRVHDADNFLLPGPGDIQDPIDNGDDSSDDDGGGGTFPITNLNDHVIVAGNSGFNPTTGFPDDTYMGGLVGFRLNADGTADILTASDYSKIGSPTVTPVPGEWVVSPPIEPEQANSYEVYMDTIASPSPWSGLPGETSSGNVNGWVSLTVGQTWTISANVDTYDALGMHSLEVDMVLLLRVIGSSVIQQTRNISLLVTLGPPAEGGFGDGGG